MYLQRVEEDMVGNLSYLLDGQQHQLELLQGKEVSGPGLKATLTREYRPNGLRVQLVPEREIELLSCHVNRLILLPKGAKVLANGFQSWSHSQEYAVNDKIPAFRAPFGNLFNQSGDYLFYHNPSQKGRLHSHFMAVTRNGERHQVMVDLAQATGYTVFEFQFPEEYVRIWKDCAGLRIQQPLDLMQVQWFQGNRTDCQTLLAKLFPRRPARMPVSGWTSWYNYYTDIDEKIILENLHTFGAQDVPIDFFQIDDGWQPAVGDWLTTNEKFPRGLTEIVQQAHAYGMQAGLWLAPFIVDPRSNILKEHPDWVLTYDGERQVSAGFNPLWGGIGKARYFALDVYHPGVRDYLRAVFDRVLNEWGFDMVKLDFLYAAALLPGHGRSRGQIMLEAMEFLRECCGEKAILGCGVPLGPSMGLVEYCRIGPDIGLNWDTKALAAVHLRERISTCNALHNSISRHLLSQTAFGNDPDVFILRDENNKLTETEKESLHLVNYIFGDLVFTSDNLNAYSPAQMRRYKSAFPLVERRITALVQNNGLYQCDFSIGALNYRFWLNLSKNAASVVFPEGLHFLKGEGLVSDEQPRAIAPHASMLLLLNRASKVLFGSNGHLFPGADLEQCEIREGVLILKRAAQAVPKAEIWINAKGESVAFRDKIYPPVALGGHSYVRVTF